MKHSFSAEVLCPVANDQVFHGAIQHPDVYIWDAWAWFDKSTGDVNFYTLASPREIYKNSDIDIQTQRDHIPHHWRHFKSTDKCQTWKDLGCVMTPRLGTDLYDSRSIWTGSILDFNGEVYAGYTGIRDVDAQHPFLQSIGLAKMNADGKFAPVSDEALSCPRRDYDAIIAKGYYLGPKDDLGTEKGEDGKMILSWRDPGMIVHDNAIHAFWGAKSSQRRDQEPVLAHGVIRFENGVAKMELMQPIFLPDIDDLTQAEVPQLSYDEKNKQFILMVSYTARVSGEQTDGDVNLQVRIYGSKDIRGPWNYIASPITAEDKRYPGVILYTETTKDSVELIYNAPFNRSASEDIMHTMPAPSRIKISS